MDNIATGKFITKKRKEQNLTQEQLAEVFGVSNRSISRWENGATMPDLDLLIEIARYFEVEIGEILEENVNTVKSRLYRSLRRLHGFLLEETEKGGTAYGA